MTPATVEGDQDRENERFQSNHELPPEKHLSIVRYMPSLSLDLTTTRLLRRRDGTESFLSVVVMIAVVEHPACRLDATQCLHLATGRAEEIDRERETLDRFRLQGAGAMPVDSGPHTAKGASW
jgi:hypothetical protein